MPLLRWIDNIDKTLVRLINGDSDHTVLDPIMLGLRHPATWTPLYGFMLCYAFRHARQCAWIFIFGTLLCLFITETSCAVFLNPWLGRFRPCYAPGFAPVLRPLMACGGVYSMPAPSAADYFGLTTFWYYGIHTFRSRKWKWIWLWPALIAYAQIYTGNHYPTDILVGGLFGAALGRLIGLVFERLWLAYNARIC